MEQFLEHFKPLLDRMPIGCMLLDQCVHSIYWNPIAQKIFGYDFPEVKGKHPFYSVALSTELAGRDEFRRLLSNTAGEETCICENRAKDGSVVTCEWRSTPIRDDDGLLAGAFLTCQDLTERKRLDEQLQQTQKMETMGLLASGIAHDFNNLLTIISGYTRMIMRDLDPTKHCYHQAEQIAEAADRATTLTSQLLAFSRRRVIQSSVLDLNTVLSKMENLLRRILGENIELTTPLGARIGGVKADQGQIEQIIMNLVINSRWAMPNGGRLTIETANVILDREHFHGSLACPPGSYVALAVSDTGHGMDAATRKRIFEPFFTTREAGEGSGIGLATVHGIVRQIGGHILVYSEPGFGTTFRIYFPVADAEIVTAAAPVSTAAETAGAGTVLLVEDEVKVLETVKLMLTRQGYSVLEASSQESAQRICGEYPHRIDLLLTDVVLRNGNGPDLARELSFLRPGVPVVYMSGYPDPFPVWDSVGVVFLQKPFSSRSLQTAIEKARAAIDSQAETCDTQSCYEGIPTGFHITADRSRGCSGV